MPRRTITPDGLSHAGAGLRGRAIRVWSVAIGLGAAVAGGALVSLVALAGCSRETEDAQPAVARADTYTTRGIVAQIPIKDNPGSAFKIHHERVPDFKTAAGTVHQPTPDVAPGMAEMTMHFPLSAGVSIEELAIGDKVEFDWTVEYFEGSTVPKWRITAIRRLSPDTELTLQDTGG